MIDPNHIPQSDYHFELPRQAMAATSENPLAPTAPEKPSSRVWVVILLVIVAWWLTMQKQNKRRALRRG